MSYIRSKRRGMMGAFDALSLAKASAPMTSTTMVASSSTQTATATDPLMAAPEVSAPAQLPRECDPFYTWSTIENQCVPMQRCPQNFRGTPPNCTPLVRTQVQLKPCADGWLRDESGQCYEPAPKGEELPGPSHDVTATSSEPVPGGTEQFDQELIGTPASTAYAGVLPGESPQTGSPQSVPSVPVSAVWTPQGPTLQGAVAAKNRAIAEIEDYLAQEGQLQVPDITGNGGNGVPKPGMSSTTKIAISAGVALGLAYLIWGRK